MYGVLESCLFALVCIQIELQRNFKLYCLYFFFSKFELPNRGCGLSTGAAYTRNFTVVDRYSFGLISLIVPVHDHLSKATTFLCSKGGHLQESCLYTQVRIFIINSPNITVFRLANLNR